jgi:hypothetical protein
LPVLNVWQYLELILLSLSCTECCHYVGLVHHQVLSVSSRISSFLVFGWCPSSMSTSSLGRLCMYSCMHVCMYVCMHAWKYHLGTSLYTPWYV